MRNTYLENVAGKLFKVTEVFENSRLIAKSYSRVRK